VQVEKMVADPRPQAICNAEIKRLQTELSEVNAKATQYKANEQIAKERLSKRTGVMWWLIVAVVVLLLCTFRKLIPIMIIIGIYSGIIAYLEIEYWHLPEDSHVKNISIMHGMLGFVISLLLAYRPNTAYDRWWEGRKKWGELVNDTRNLSVKLNAILNEENGPDKAAQKAFFRRMIPNFVIAVKEHLRAGVLLEELNLTPEELNRISEKKHIPLALVGEMYERLFQLKKAGTISEEEMISLDKNMNSLMDICGACERIKNTPIPFSYSLFLKKFIFIYVVTMPLAFVATFGYLSALIATFVFYVLVSMEVLAEEIEDPFGKDDNDLPTDDLSSRIQTVVEDTLK
jgi:putative membrane protein